MRLAVHHLDISNVRADALFVSALQRSEEPTARQVRRAVVAAVRAYGGRAARHRWRRNSVITPEAAVARMRWARAVTSAAFTGPGRAPARTRLGAARLVARTGRAA